MNTDRTSWKNTLYPVDWIVLGYCVTMALALFVLGRPIIRYADEIIFYMGTGALTILITRFLDDSAGGWRTFVRILYPALMFTFFYRVTAGQMFLLSDSFFDDQLVSLERSLFGVNLTLYIDRHLPNLVLTEVLSLCYFCYYLILPGFLIFAYLRRDYPIIRQFLTAASLTFFVSYVVFWLYPVEGPRWFLAGRYVNSVDGPLLRRLVEFVIENAAVRGGAMPSSHTGVAVVAMIFCFKYYRKAGWLLLPVVLGLALGTVWGRFHYVSDVVVGAVIGLVALWAVWKYFPLPSHTIELAEAAKEPRSQNVS